MERERRYAGERDRERRGDLEFRDWRGERERDLSDLQEQTQTIVETCGMKRFCSGNLS